MIQWDEMAHNYQRRAANNLLTKRHHCLFLDPGLGKTSIVLRALLHIKKTVGYRKTLVVGPLRVISSSWPGELSKWSEFSELRAEVFHGRNPLEIIESKADIILVNFEYLRKMNDICLKTFKSPFKKYSYNLAKFYRLNGLVVDELTAFKNPNSQRFKIMSRNVEGFDFRWGLTGTPVANNLEHIFGQAYIIDNGMQFGKYITNFRNTYFRQVGYGGYQYEIRGPKERDEIYAKIALLGTRMAAEDFLELPDFTYNVIKVELDDKAKKIYKDMWKNLVVQLSDSTVSAANKAASLIKCRQIASGMLYNGNSDVVHIHDAKVSAIENLVDELDGKPLLVFINFRAEAELLQKTFKNAEIIYGGTSSEKSSDIIHRWNKGDVPMLITHPATMAHGVNLQHGGNHVCWYTLPFGDLEQFEQGNRRIFRQGQKESKVVCHKIIADGTIDLYADKLLGMKHMGQTALFEYLKTETSNGLS